MTPNCPTPSNTLKAHWLICALMLLLLVIYNVVCHWYGQSVRLNFEEQERLVIRSILYTLTIITFPLTNLVRHILIRLNQTLPGDKSAEQRYLLTIIVTQSMIAAISVFGPLMFVLGDHYNTLYIFSVLGVLGIALHRPKPDEYQSIIQALSTKSAQ